MKSQKSIEIKNSQAIQGNTRNSWRIEKIHKSSINFVTSPEMLEIHRNRRKFQEIEETPS